MTDGELSGAVERADATSSVPVHQFEGGRSGVFAACTRCDHAAPAGGHEDKTFETCPDCGAGVSILTCDGGTDPDDRDESSVYEPGVRDPPSPQDQEFGPRGWLLVAAIVVAFLVIPATIYLNAANVIALPFRAAFLALPMIPAVALAVLAVWVTTTE